MIISTATNISDKPAPNQVSKRSTSLTVGWGKSSGCSGISGMAGNSAPMWSRGHQMLARPRSSRRHRPFRHRRAIPSSLYLLICLVLRGSPRWQLTLRLPATLCIKSPVPFLLRLPARRSGTPWTRSPTLSPPLESRRSPARWHTLTPIQIRALVHQVMNCPRSKRLLS